MNLLFVQSYNIGIALASLDAVQALSRVQGGDCSCVGVCDAPRLALKKYVYQSSQHPSPCCGLVAADAWSTLNRTVRAKGVIPLSQYTTHTILLAPNPIVSGSHHFLGKALFIYRPTLLAQRLNWLTIQTHQIIHKGWLIGGKEWGNNKYMGANNGANNEVVRINNNVKTPVVNIDFSIVMIWGVGLVVANQTVQWSVMHSVELDSGTQAVLRGYSLATTNLMIDNNYDVSIAYAYTNNACRVGTGPNTCVEVIAEALPSSTSKASSLHSGRCGGRLCTELDGGLVKIHTTGAYTDDNNPKTENLDNNNDNSTYKDAINLFHHNKLQFNTITTLFQLSNSCISQTIPIQTDPAVHPLPWYTFHQQTVF